MSAKNGRPTKSKQLEIKNKLMPYYERGLSANFTSKKTGFNIKTVCKYYNNWAEEINGKYFGDFIDRQKDGKKQMLFSMDRIIFELYDLLDVINYEISSYQKKKQRIPNHLFSMKLKCAKEIMNFIDQKFSLDFTPTLDLHIQEIRAKLRGPVADDFRKKIYDTPQN